MIAAMASDDDPVFKALADPTRRLLLDRLLTSDGRTLTQLEAGVEMTRFGVMKHLRILEDAGLIVTKRSGREKLHFLNAVPVRLIHDRWIDKYTERRVSALADLKTLLERQSMTTTTTDTVTTQVFRVHIKATPEAIWEAITSPEWTARYGFRAPSEYELRPGGSFRSLACEEMKAMGAPDVIGEGEVLEADAPNRLVQTWRMLFEPNQAAEPLTKLTWEIEAVGDGVSRLTVTHDLADAPIHAALVSGAVVEGLEGTGAGWPFILSDLKTLLETGSAMAVAS